MQRNTQRPKSKNINLQIDKLDIIKNTTSVGVKLLKKELNE